MKNLKKYALTLIAASLCLSPGKVRGMQRIEQFGQDAIESIANSSAWSWICDSLVSLGQNVAGCESYHGHTYDDLYQPTATQRMCLAYVQLLGYVCPKIPKGGIPEISAHDLDTTAQCPMLDNKTQRALSESFPSIQSVTQQQEPMLDPFLTTSGQNLPTAVDVEEQEKLHDTESTIPQSVCFTSEKNTRICCDLNQGLSLTCCGQEAPTQCISFNMLDNDNPLENCCNADAQGEITCSTDLCSNSDAAVGPCCDGGKLANKTIGETYGPQHRELASPLDKIIERNNFTDIEIILEQDNTDIEKILVQNNSAFTTNNDGLRVLVDYIRYLEKNLKISPEHKVPKIIIRKMQPWGTRIVDKMSTNTNKILSLSQHKELPSLDYILGHEIAHNYQNQLLFPLPLRLLRPGFEISADILGCLASNYSNAAIIGSQFLNYNKRDLNDICSTPPLTINRENAKEICNLLNLNLEDREEISCRWNGEEMIDSNGCPAGYHPRKSVRGTILLKLSTMIKAAVKYLEQQEQCSGNNDESKQTI